MSRLRRAADSIASGDIVDKMVRTNQSWNLLPDEVCLGSNVMLLLSKLLCLGLGYALLCPPSSVHEW